jgi:hypothetical protein
VKRVTLAKTDFASRITDNAGTASLDHFHFGATPQTKLLEPLYLARMARE